MTPAADRRRLLFAVRSLVNPGGGAERALAELTRELAGRGHRVAILTFDPPSRRWFYDFAPSVSRIGIGVGDTSRSATAWESLRRLSRLGAAVRQADVQVAVGFMYSMYVPLRLALRDPNIRFVASEHNVAENSTSTPWVYRRLIDRVLAKADAVTIPTIGAQSTFAPPIAERMRVIANPVVAATPHTFARTSQRTLTVLNVGRLFPQKDQATLIDAFARVAPSRPNWILEIVGDGPLRGVLEQRAAAAGIADCVRFVGVVRDVEARLRSASILAVSSRYESFGLATAEALAVGTPAIGFSDCPGTNEVIQHEVNGLLVPGAIDARGRSDALAAGLGRLMDDESLRRRLGEAGPSTIVHLSPSRVADQWEALIEDLLTERVVRC